VLTLLFRITTSAALLAFAAAPAAAQQSAPLPTQTPDPHADAEPDDIIVEGYRDRKDMDTRTGVPTGINSTQNRVKYGYSERIAKCAARGKLSGMARLRAVVDGEVNSANYRMAQDRLVRSNITCSESPSLLSFNGPPRTVAELKQALESRLANNDLHASGDFTGVSGQVEATPLGYSIYDRGAFTVEALKRFAPDLKLTKAETGNPAVQSRFNLREVPRNRMRLPLDYRYFEIAVCMVRVEPRLAVRLAMSGGSARVGDVQEALIDRARVCVGNSPKVQVDPTQFRLYIADAVYRWAVAARAVDTLIPPDGIAQAG